jgi:hypothetical protein
MSAHCCCDNFLASLECVNAVADRILLGIGWACIFVGIMGIIIDIIAACCNEELNSNRRH